MYKLGKISCVISIFQKTILKNVHNRKIVRTNTYMNSLTKKAIAQQTNVTCISGFSIIPESTADQATVSTNNLTS